LVELAKKNLVLVNQSNKQKLSDFVEIREQIARRAQDIIPHIVDTKQTDWPLAESVAMNPSMTVSPMPIRKFQSPRGPVYQGNEIPKSVQYERLRRDGISVPDWQEIRPDEAFNSEEWGPYVVVKPNLGRCGREIKIKKTSKVWYRPPEGDLADQPTTTASMLVQRFIYTGQWASSFRVVTLFGKPLLCWHCEIDHNLPPLQDKLGFARQGGINIVSNKRSSTYRLSFDEEVIALAVAAQRSFPDQPLLGHDVARDCETGKLYILECNPRGDTWLFSSYTGTEIQKAHSINFYTQFGGLSKVAEILIDETRKRAQ
jgi:hypothetical protein